MGPQCDQFMFPLLEVFDPLVYAPRCVASDQQRSKGLPLGSALHGGLISRIAPRRFGVRPTLTAYICDTTMLASAQGMLASAR